MYITLYFLFSQSLEPTDEYQFSEVTLEDSPPSGGEVLQRDLPISESQRCDNDQSYSETRVSETSDWNTPQCSVVNQSSLILKRESKMSAEAQSAAADLAELMEKLKPHWPSKSDSVGLSPHAQMQIAMNAFIAAKSDKMTELMEDDKLIDTPDESLDKEKHDAVQKAPAPTKPKLDSAIESKIPSPCSGNKTVVNQNLDRLSIDGKDESQLQMELSQLERIVQDLCSEVSGSKHSSGPGEPSLSVVAEHEKPAKPSVSRIPTPIRIKTPFALPGRDKQQESSTTIALYPPKPAMNTNSYMSIDCHINGSSKVPNSMGFVHHPNNNRNSAFGRTIHSSARPLTKTKTGPIPPYQRPVQPNTRMTGPQQRKPVSPPARPIQRTPLNKWTSHIPCTRNHNQSTNSESERTSMLPSREISKSALLPRTNSYRQLFQMKQTLAAKSAVPIQLRKGGTQQGYGTPRGGLDSYSRSSRSRGRTPMIPSERDRSLGRPMNVPGNKHNKPMGSGAGSMGAHGAGFGMTIPIDYNSNSPYKG